MVIDLQYSELSRFDHKYREQRKTDNEAGQSCQVTGAENQ